MPESNRSNGRDIEVQIDRLPNHSEVAFHIGYLHENSTVSFFSNENRKIFLGNNGFLSEHGTHDLNPENPSLQASVLPSATSSVRSHLVHFGEGTGRTSYRLMAHEAELQNTLDKMELAYEEGSTIAKLVFPSEEQDIRFVIENKVPNQVVLFNFTIDGRTLACALRSGDFYIINIPHSVSGINFTLSIVEPSNLIPPKALEALQPEDDSCNQSGGTAHVDIFIDPVGGGNDSSGGG